MVKITFWNTHTFIFLCFTLAFAIFKGMSLEFGISAILAFICALGWELEQLQTKTDRMEEQLAQLTKGIKQ